MKICTSINEPTPEIVTPPGKLISTEDNYWWTEKKYKLPLKIEFKVKCLKKSDEILPMFTEKKRPWSGASSPIALSWYLSSYSSTFTFRSRIFGAFPISQRHAQPIIAEVDRFYDMKCKIYEKNAEYSIDGVKYASCKLSQGDVPLEGYFGMGNYNDNHCQFKDLKITPILPHS